MSKSPRKTGCGCVLFIRATLWIAFFLFGIACFAPGQAIWAAPSAIGALLLLLILRRV